MSTISQTETLFLARKSAVLYQPHWHERVLHRAVAGFFHHFYSLIERGSDALENRQAEKSPCQPDAPTRRCLEQAQPGDLIFAQLPSLRARVLRKLLGGASYTHVGVVVHAIDGLALVHSVRGTHLREYRNGGVIRQPLPGFLVGGALRLEHYRPRNEHLAGQLAASAAEAARQRVPYDIHYALWDENAVYCSEFVWRLGLSVGQDWVEDRFLRIGLPGCRTRFILPEAIARSPLLERVG